MEMFAIEGGYPLRGEITVEGSKNAALPVMAASIMIGEPVTLGRVPALQDVWTMTQLLRSMGVSVECRPPSFPGAGQELLINACQISSAVAPSDLVRQMRAGVCVLGPLLARCGTAQVALPGGCNIGKRPIDLHLKGLAALGADLRLDNGWVIGKAARLRGADICLSGPQGSTVTGTCNVMAAATLATGRTVIRSAACEPEVANLGNFLNSAGARIQGLGTSVIEIIGVDRLHQVSHTIISDRIEAATLGIAAAITGGEIVLHNAPVGDMHAILNVLRECGVEIYNLTNPASDSVSADQCTLSSHSLSNHSTLRFSVPRSLSPIRVSALPFPGWPTDAQAQLTALLTLVPGVSCVTDHVFPDRFLHQRELQRMGADIQVSGGTAKIRGVKELHGAVVWATDLRASAALVLAALAARGISSVRQVHHLDRGYSAFETRLSHLGARIQRLQEPVPGGPVPGEPVPAPHFRDRTGLATSRQPNQTAFP